MFAYFLNIRFRIVTVVSWERKGDFKHYVNGRVSTFNKTILIFEVQLFFTKCYGLDQHSTSILSTVPRNLIDFTNLPNQCISGPSRTRPGL